MNFPVASSLNEAYCIIIYYTKIYCCTNDNELFSIEENTDIDFGLLVIGKQ